MYTSEVRMDAVYAPTDSTVAIAQVEALRTHGGQFLLFPSTAFWWLERSNAFQEHLDTNGHCIRSDENCIIYRLHQPKLDSTEAR